MKTVGAAHLSPKSRKNRFCRIGGEPCGSPPPQNGAGGVNRTPLKHLKGAPWQRRPGNRTRSPASYAILTLGSLPDGEGRTSRIQPSCHLLFLLHEFQEGSRIETPRGSLPGFPSGNLATRIPSITEGRSLAPRSFTRTAIGCSHDQPTQREQYGLTTFHTNDTTRLGSLYTPRVFFRP